MWLRAKLSRLGTLVLLLLTAALVAFAPMAHADATVLLEEPYSYDGALAGTGHTAVYLARVCADSPVVLRRCQPGEDGVVISRYTRIAGYDWIAIPLIPYLYAVEKPEDVPLFVDAKLVAFLRDQYRRSHLEDIAPDTEAGDAPKGDWIQLVGSSYDRTSYGFQIDTTEAQDDALIEWFNSRPNRATYNAVSRNCANFVRDVVNFYYPKAVSHGFITDLEVTTPKHAAKSLVKFSKHDPDIQLTRIVFPQVPGTMKRSKPVRGVLESLVRAKKYVLPFAAFHPIVAGSIVTVYFFGDRFNPAKNAMVFNTDGEPEAPLSKDERRMYLKNLKTETQNSGNDPDHDRLVWRRFQENAQFQLDGSGHPILSGTYENEVVKVGISRDDLIPSDAPQDLQKGLLLTRLHQELGRSRAPRISSDRFHDDWHLLQAVDSAENKRPEQKPTDRAQLLR